MIYFYCCSLYLYNWIPECLRMHLVTASGKSPTAFLRVLRPLTLTMPKTIISEANFTKLQDRCKEYYGLLRRRKGESATLRLERVAARQKIIDDLVVECNENGADLTASKLVSYFQNNRKKLLGLDDGDEPGEGSEDEDHGDPQKFTKWTKRQVFEEQNKNVINAKIGHPKGSAAYLAAYQPIVAEMFQKVEGEADAKLDAEVKLRNSWGLPESIQQRYVVS